MSGQVSAPAPSFGLPAQEALSVFPVSLSDARASRLFIHLAFIGCLCLQRFGLVFGVSAIFLSLPLFLGMLGWLVLTGRANFRMPVVLLFVALLTAEALSATLALVAPDPRVGIGLLSPIALAINCILLLVVPGSRFDRSQVLPIFLFYARLCAVAGILQYLLQFVGVKLFAFQIFAPALRPILVEKLFAFNPLLEYGGAIVRTNGFFLLEPSIFSQLLVLGVCVEYFVFGRMKYLPLYGLAYLLSYSGTGLLCLLLALPLYAFIFWRQASRVIYFGALGLMLVGVAAVALPSQFASLAGRSNEFQGKGSSGYARYVQQFEVLDVVLDEPRSVIGYGPGATDRATFWVRGSGSAIQKLLIDYGWIGLGLFAAFLIKALWRNDLAIIPLLCLVMFQFGGGYMLFSPLYVLMAMLCIWSVPPTRQAAIA